MKKNLYIPKQTREKIVSYCNKHIVPDAEYIENPSFDHPMDWFVEYFSFIPDPKLRNHLAEAYYQARFAYKIMQGLILTGVKRIAFFKFQIQQYASIYEALLDYTLETYHKKEIETRILNNDEYRPVSAFANNTEMYIIVNTKKVTVFPCVLRKGTRPLKTVKMTEKTKIGVDLGIFDVSIKESVDALYEERNCIHILKAAQSNYRPTLKECKRAFELMPQIVEAVKNHLVQLKNNKVSLSSQVEVQ